MRTSSVWIVLALLFTGCTTMREGSSVGPARAPFEESSLTRAQKIVYGSHYVDFYATLRPDTASQTCFSIRIETDDNQLDSALKWDAYLKRVGYASIRVDFLSYLFEPGDKYPLVYEAEACADYVWDRSEPLYLYVKPRLGKGVDPIRLEWSI